MNIREQTDGSVMRPLSSVEAQYKCFSYSYSHFGPIPHPGIILCVIESNREKVPSAALVACVWPVRKCTIQFKIGDGRPRVLSLADFDSYSSS